MHAIFLLAVAALPNDETLRRLKRELNMKKLGYLLTTFAFLLVLFFALALFTRPSVREGHAYNTKNHVALYLFTYKTLPTNYVLKSQVKNYGVQPSDGKYIGGDVFYYSGRIKEYTACTDLRECDLSYPNNDVKRGLNRLVYTADCSEIYYSATHYGDKGEPAFVPVTLSSIYAVSTSFCIAFFVITAAEATVFVVFFTVNKAKKAEYLAELGTSFALAAVTYITVLLSPLILLVMLVDKVKNALEYARER